jgi:hypothetical protein
MKKELETNGRKRSIMRKGRSGRIERWKPEVVRRNRKGEQQSECE